MKRQQTTMNRQSMKKRMTRILSVTLILATLLAALGVSAAATTGNPFTDVKSSDWFYNSVQWAVGKGITAGTTPTTFSPNKSCTRAEAVQFLWNEAGKTPPKTTANPFKDVKKTDWFYNAVQWAVDNKITSGTSATTFEPNKPCTRAEIMMFVYKLANGSPVSYNNPFKDVKNGNWFYDAVLWGVKNGITSGTSATTFSPNATCKRCEIVTFLYNYETKVKAQQTATPTPSPTPTPTPKPTPAPTPTPGNTGSTGGSFPASTGKYDYELYFIDGMGETLYSTGQNEEANGRIVYIKTNNPDPFSFDISLNNKSVIGSSSRFDDVVYSENVDYQGLRKVQGGYLAAIAIGNTGVAFNNGKATVELTIREWEDPDDVYNPNYTVAKRFNLTVTDYTWEQNQAFDDLMKKAGCTSSMNSMQKFKAVEKYLQSLRDRSHALYEQYIRNASAATKESAIATYLQEAKKAGAIMYPTNCEGHLVYLVQEGYGTWFDTMRMDSAASPTVLERLANYIGGFQEIDNLYDNSERGSVEWNNSHWKCKVVYQGETYLAECCPSSQTGEVGTVKPIDFTKTSNFLRFA